jgi:hypothetical protein
MHRELPSTSCLEAFNNTAQNSAVAVQPLTRYHALARLQDLVVSSLAASQVPLRITIVDYPMKRLNRTDRDCALATNDLTRGGVYRIAQLSSRE